MLDYRGRDTRRLLPLMQRAPYTTWASYICPDCCDEIEAVLPPLDEDDGWPVCRDCDLPYNLVAPITDPDLVAEIEAELRA